MSAAAEAIDVGQSVHAKAQAHEAQVIGSLILRPSMLDDVSEVIGSEDFYSPKHSLIWDAIGRLHDAGSAVDQVSVADQLGRDGHLRSVGGFSGIHAITAAVSLSANAVWHAQRVRDAALLRKVGAAATALHDMSLEQTATEDEALAVVDAARAELDKLASRDVAELSHEDGVWASIEALAEPPGDPTPWPKVTRSIAGWKPGQLYIIAARPAGGKSIAGVMSAVDMARHGKTALLFSMEMPRTDLYHRMLVARAEVDMGKLQTRRLSETDHRRLQEAARDIASLPLIVDDRASLSVAQIRAKVRAAKRHGPVGIVVVDYLGLIRPPSYAPKNDRRVQVDAISRSLKELAMDAQVPVVAMAQINRGPEGRMDKMPLASDLRESGGIEADADVVMVLHREVTAVGPDASAEDLRKASTIQMGIAKNRHGEMTRHEFVWQGHYSRFTDPKDL